MRLGSLGIRGSVTSCDKKGGKRKAKKSENNRFKRIFGTRSSGLHIYINMYWTLTSQWNVVIGLKTGISLQDRRSTIVGVLGQQQARESVHVLGLAGPTRTWILTS